MRTLVILSALLVAAVTNARAQNVQQQLALADTAFMHGDWTRAKQLYHAVTQLDSTRSRAWFRMGVAAQEVKDYALAAQGYRHAIALKLQVPPALYRLAKLEARAGHRDSALALLRLDLATGGAPTGATISTEPEFATLRTNPAFRAMIKTADSLAYPCRNNPKAHEFDFWIGQWDVTQFNAPPIPHGPGTGYNDVHPLLEGCVLLENWAGAGGGTGKSFNWYDTNIKKWRQAWMSDGGGPLDYVGEYKDGAMRFDGWTLQPDGSHLLQRLTFFNISRDTVRQLFESSADSGKTWQSGFDGRYVRRKAATKRP